MAVSPLWHDWKQSIVCTCLLIKQPAGCFVLVSQPRYKKKKIFKVFLLLMRFSSQPLAPHSIKMREKPIYKNCDNQVFVLSTNQMHIWWSAGLKSTPLVLHLKLIVLHAEMIPDGDITGVCLSWALRNRCLSERLRCKPGALSLKDNRILPDGRDLTKNSIELPYGNCRSLCFWGFNSTWDWEYLRIFDHFVISISWNPLFLSNGSTTLKC